MFLLVSVGCVCQRVFVCMYVCVFVRVNMSVVSVCVCV